MATKTYVFVFIWGLRNILFWMKIVLYANSNSANFDVRHYVFDYGPFMAGGSFEAGYALANFMGIGATVDKFPLVIPKIGGVPTPFMLYRQGFGHHIFGELYEVNLDMLNTMDLYANEEERFLRRMADVRLLEEEAEKKMMNRTGNDVVQCWIWFKRTTETELMRMSFHPVFKKGVDFDYFDCSKNP